MKRKQILLVLSSLILVGGRATGPKAGTPIQEPRKVEKALWLRARLLPRYRPLSIAMS